MKTIKTIQNVFAIVITEFRSQFANNALNHLKETVSIDDYNEAVETFRSVSRIFLDEACV